MRGREKGKEERKEGGEGGRESRREGGREGGKKEGEKRHFMTVQDFLGYINLDHSKAVLPNGNRCTQFLSLKCFW